MEIERKFLLNDELLDKHKIKESFILEQYYISYSPEIRFRCKVKNDIKTCYMTTKSEGDLIRNEIEEEIPFSVYEENKKSHLGNVINKKRCIIDLQDNLIAEVDYYFNQLKGLKVVEVEFASEEEANKFSNNIPEWFGKEITFDKQYKNKNLSESI